SRIRGTDLGTRQLVPCLRIGRHAVRSDGGGVRRKNGRHRPCELSRIHIVAMHSRRRWYFHWVRREVERQVLIERGVADSSPVIYDELRRSQVYNLTGP